VVGADCVLLCPPRSEAVIARVITNRDASKPIADGINCNRVGDQEIAQHEIKL
jgi:hypothetical protein